MEHAIRGVPMTPLPPKSGKRCCVRKYPTNTMKTGESFSYPGTVEQAEQYCYQFNSKNQKTGKRARLSAGHCPEGSLRIWRTQ